MHFPRDSKGSFGHDLLSWKRTFLKGAKFKRVQKVGCKKASIFKIGCKKAKVQESRGAKKLYSHFYPLGLVVSFERKHSLNVGFPPNLQLLACFRAKV